MQYVLLRYRQNKSKIQEFSIFRLLSHGTFGHCTVPEVSRRIKLAFTPSVRFYTKRALLKLLLLRGLFRATCAEKELIITRRVNIEL